MVSLGFGAEKDVITSMNTPTQIKLSATLNVGQWYLLPICKSIKSRTHLNHILSHKFPIAPARTSPKARFDVKTVLSDLV